MPYCQNCGTKLPDGAKFCAECGTAAHAQQPPQAPKAKRGMTGTIIALAAVALVLLVVVAVLLTLHLSARKDTVAAVETIAPSQETTAPKQKPTEPESLAEATATPAVNGHGVEVADIAVLLESYRDITNEIIGSTDSSLGEQYNCGYLYDYDDDGYPELVLLYTTDSYTLTATIVRRTDDSENPLRTDCELWSYMAGGAGGAIYSGTLDNGTPVLFLEAKSWEGETSVHNVRVYSLADTDIMLMYRLEYYCDLEGDLMNCWVFNGEDELLSRDNTEQFLNIFNAMEYIEAQFPSEQYGMALADLFSDETMAAYFS